MKENKEVVCFNCTFMCVYKNRFFYERKKNNLATKPIKRKRPKANKKATKKNILSLEKIKKLCV